MTPVEIKSIRMRLKLTQQAFAELLSVSFATVNRWERGKTVPQPDRIDRIRDLLRTPLPSKPRPRSHKVWRVSWSGTIGAWTIDWATYKDFKRGDVITKVDKGKKP